MELLNEKSMPLVQIFIATFNRPGMVLKAIHSALNQDFKSFEVIVSDNSTNSETENLVKKISDKRLFYKKRDPSLPPIDHLNAILKDVKSEYFVIFHDDDVMFPEMLYVLFKGFDKYQNNNIVAIGSNALIMKNYKKTNKKFRRAFNKDLLLQNSIDLAKLYMIKNGIVPFSSYMYKKQVAELLYLDTNKGGKYCDVSFLLDLFSFGNVINLDTPLMFLNQHSMQDSRESSFEDKSKLNNYILKTTTIKRKDKNFIKFRLENMYGEISSLVKYDRLKFWSKRQFKIFMFFIKYDCIDYALKIIIKYFMHKITQLPSKIKFNSL